MYNIHIIYTYIYIYDVFTCIWLVYMMYLHVYMILYSECPLLSCCDTDGTAQLDSHITAAIEKLGIRIVYQLPKYILNSSLLLDRYIYLPTAKGKFDQSLFLQMSSSVCQDHRAITAP